MHLGTVFQLGAATGSNAAVPLGAIGLGGATFRVPVGFAEYYVDSLALADSAGDPEEDEYAYWSAVLRLGGFGGEVIRASNGGRWHHSTTGTLPIALATTFQGGEAAVNPLGKAIKRITQGEGDSVAALAAVVCQRP